MEAVSGYLFRNRNRLIMLTQELVRIDTVLGNETSAAEVLAWRLKEEGIQSQFIGKDPRRKSLIATIGRGKRTLLLNGHLDTVPAGDIQKWRYPPFSGTVAEGRIYGRGSYDMKGSVAAAAFAAIALVKTNLKLDGKLQLVFNSDEESGRHSGIREYLAQLRDEPDAAICGEPMWDKTLRIGAKGIYRFELITRGTTGHTAFPKSGINAVTKMAKLLLALEKLRLKHKKSPMFSKPHITPGTVIEGGTAINVFPDECRALVDCRLSLGQSYAQTVKAIDRALRAVSASDRDIRYTVREIGFAPAALTKRDAPFVKLCSEAIKGSFGFRPKIGIVDGTTDGNFLIERGIPTAIFGPTGGGVHAENEYVEIAGLLSASQTFACVALKFLKAR